MWLRKLLCKLNIHFHPEKDGWYISGLSHGRCYACGEFIKKCEDSVWRKADSE